MGRQHLSSSTLCYSPKEGRWETCPAHYGAQAVMSTHVIKHPGGVRTAINVTGTNTPGSVTDPSPGPLQGEKLVGLAPLAPKTALLHWKACNRFPWKNARLCQFACTLLQLRTIRCFQSAVLQQLCLHFTDLSSFARDKTPFLGQIRSACHSTLYLMVLAVCFCSY